MTTYHTCLVLGGPTNQAFSSSICSAPHEHKRDHLPLISPCRSRREYTSRSISTTSQPSLPIRKLTRVQRLWAMSLIMLANTIRGLPSIEYTSQDTIAIRRRITSVSWHSRMHLLLGLTCAYCPKQPAGMANRKPCHKRLCFCQVQSAFSFAAIKCPLQDTSSPYLSGHQMN